MEVPRLQSRRLLLREWRDGDQAWRHMALLAGHWALRGDAWGAGYATEAARTAIAWARDALGADALISIIAPENEASARVARRLGMTPAAPSRLQGEPVVIWHL